MFVKEPEHGDPNPSPPRLGTITEAKQLANGCLMCITNKDCKLTLLPDELALIITSQQEES